MTKWIFVYFVLSMLTSMNAFASGCEKKYQMAAQALDHQRAQCGLSDINTKVFCKVAGKINIPVEFYGFRFTINMAAAYRTLNQFHLIPNNLRKTSKLLKEAKVGQGRLVKRMAKRIARNLPDSSYAQVISMVKKMDAQEKFCQGTELYTFKQIRLMVEDELARE